MPIFTYDDLINWSQSGTLWQRDALRRVLAQRDLSDIDITELTELAKAGSSATTAGVSPQPATAGDVRMSLDPMPAVNVVRIRNIAQVNALASGPIEFSAVGLTIVYGENGSGKTGVGRILKRACRARSPGGPILQNVFRTESTSPACATIDYLVGDEERTHDWVDGGESEPALRSVTIFDADCADVQVGEANQILYVPELLSVFRSWAIALEMVAANIRAEKAELGSAPSILDDLNLGDTTAAGRYLATLSRNSDRQTLAELSNLEEAESARLTELERALADDPEVRVKSVEALGRRLAELNIHLDSAWELFSEAACDKIKELVEEAKASESAAEATRRVFSANSTLEGVGTEEWRLLWNAARHYSEGHAYEGEAFPVVRGGATCILCQQPLSDDATRRLISFEEFVQDEVQQQAMRAREDLETEIAKVRSFSLPHSTREILGELQLLGNGRRESVRRFLVEAKLRQRHLVRHALGKSEYNPPPFSPKPDLAEVGEQIKTEVTQLSAALDHDSRAEMNRERAELADRVKLASARTTVLEEVARLGHLERLDAAIATCNTQAITRKAGEVEQLIVTQRLQDHFSQTLSEIGYSDAPVTVALGAGFRGEHSYVLEVTGARSTRPKEILSEGEQTCVALAGFLADLETSENRSGIILDDPLTSLDHRYRKRVAGRLVKEARERQMVILTHDVVFLYFLRRSSAELNVDLKEISLRRGYRGNHGVAEDGPPWVALSVNRRMGRLRSDLQTAEALLSNGDRVEYERHVSLIYERLRESLERAVEEVLLNGTVIRFGDSVQTRRMTRLPDISEAGIQLVTSEMSRCSEFEHDPAHAAFGGVPDPDIVRADILRLSGWVSELRDNRHRN